MSDVSRRSTAPAHDSEREALVAAQQRALRKMDRATPARKERAALDHLRTLAAIAAYDRERGPTVPTRTASGYRNQAAPSGASRTNTSRHNLADTSRRHNTPKADPKRLGLPPLSHQERGA